MTTGVGRAEETVREEKLGRSYSGESLRHVAMPLGGLGAGQISICGDGGLRQWQMVNQINHLGFVPDSFFVIRAASIEPPLNVVKALQSEERMEMDGSETPLVNDDHIPPDQRSLLDRFSGVERTTFTGAYPFARVEYEDAELPVEVELEAYTPFVPLDSEASGLPAAVFTFRLKNRWEHEVIGCLGGTLQNAVGWDGITEISGNRCPLYGGNTNRAKRGRGFTSVSMENLSLPEDHPGSGNMTLAALDTGAISYPQWATPEEFMRFVGGINPLLYLSDPGKLKERTLKNRPFPLSEPSPSGQTWNGGLLVPYRLEPGEETSMTFVVAWHFPNRYVNFDQFGSRRDYGKSRFWVGNAYADRFADSEKVVEHFVRNRKALEGGSRKWVEAVNHGTLPSWMRETIAAQGVPMRSPTCFRAEDGKFYGFEGSLGESTGMSLGTYGGSCPLNCTHVWNYEQALSRLFPDLERTMRETDLDHVQAPGGYIPHRTVLPLYLPQFWDEPIGGPTNPALDGMLGTVLKVYREARQGAGREWLDRMWPETKKLVEYIRGKWDTNGDGVLRGEQPNTYDIAFYGPNMFIGGLWLAALRAAEEMAKIQREYDFADELHSLFERASERYNELLWNGEYYVQILDPDGPAEDQFGDGCHSDQLFGQWWAHLLDLGHILPKERVKTTLRSIVGYNFREGFRDFEHGYRVFADSDDSGLLMCSWPRGGRPEVPVRYCDEVWTGIEYQVGAHLIIEGMVDEGLKILAALRERYSGERRNPYNEIECGDHYVRAMAGWSALEAVSGFRYDALQDSLSFAPVGDPEEFGSVFVAGSGWGTFSRNSDPTKPRFTMTCDIGVVKISKLSLPDLELEKATMNITGGGESQPLIFQPVDESTVKFDRTLCLEAGSSLELHEENAVREG